VESSLTLASHHRLVFINPLEPINILQIIYNQVPLFSKICANPQRPQKQADNSTPQCPLNIPNTIAKCGRKGKKTNKTWHSDYLNLVTLALQMESTLVLGTIHKARTRLHYSSTPTYSERRPNQSNNNINQQLKIKTLLIRLKT
jgi:hypothetical protein